MKRLYMFSQCAFQILLNTRRCRSFIVLLLFVFGIAGCGEQNVEPRHYNPSSPLPLRVDASEVKAKNKKAPDKNLQPPKSTPTPTPTSVPTPIPPPTPTPEKTKVSPTPTPATKIAVAKPERSPVPSQDKEEQEGKSQNSALLESADDTQKPESAADKKEAENEPIVAPDGTKIDKLFVCKKVVDRNPVGCSDSFSLSETGSVFTWMRVSHVTPPSIIKHMYYWQDKFIASVNLKLKYTSMRTWSQKTFKADHAGAWKVVLATEDGEVIAVREWTVTP